MSISKALKEKGWLVGAHRHWQILRKPQLGVGSKEAGTGTGQCRCGGDGQGPWWVFDTPTEQRPLFSWLWLLSLPMSPTSGHEVLTAPVLCCLLSHPPQNLQGVVLLTCTWQHHTHSHFTLPPGRALIIPRGNGAPSPGDGGQGLAIQLAEAHQGLSQ